MRGTVLLLGLAVFSGALSAAETWQPLWNGKNLAGWGTYLIKPHPSTDLPGAARAADGNYLEPIGLNRDPLHVFSVVEVEGRPAIRISGQVFGELRSSRSFENFHLRLQFKWGVKKWPPRDKAGTPRDSGVLYYVHCPSGVEGRTWSRSIELQIQEHDVGDLYAVLSQVSVRSTLRPGGGEKPVYDYNPAGEWKVFSQIPGWVGRCVKQPDNEKPTGEWNTVEIVALGEDTLHIVNGKVVMRLHGPRRIDGPKPVPVTSGPIILQSEGAEIFYRDLEVRSIDAIPAEYAEPKNVRN